MHTYAYLRFSCVLLRRQRLRDEPISHPEAYQMSMNIQTYVNSVTEYLNCISFSVHRRKKKKKKPIHFDMSMSRIRDHKQQSPWKENT